MRPRRLPPLRSPTERTPRTLALALAIFVLFSFAPARRARAGNDDGVLLGNEAAMAGGAVTAIVADGSATWYNPAGIAGVDRDTLDLSGSATMLRIAVTPGLLQSSTGHQANGSYYEFLGIPSAVTLVRRLDRRTAVALGIFVPELTNHADRVALDDPVPRPAPEPDRLARWRLNYQESSSAYYGGLTLGIVLAPNIRIGFSALGAYHQHAISSELLGAAQSEDRTTATFGLSTMLSLQAVSLEAAAGLQWEIVPGLHLGLSVRTPGLLVGSQYRVSDTTMAASADGIHFATVDQTGLEAQFDVIRPARVRLGLAYRWSSGWIAIEGDVQHELRRPEIGVDREWTGGARIGGRIFLDRQLSLGAGFFTDLDATRTIDSYADTRLDFYGGTVGLEVRNPHRLGEGENASDMVFVNTFALRYAASVGEIGGLRFDLDAPADNVVAIVPVSTQVHELSLHIGSALYF
jgi:hypothetical protein